MKLTYADRETIWAVIENDDWIQPGELVTEANIIGRAYLAGKRAGRKDMRERAAKACEGEDCDQTEYRCMSLGRVAAAIRALGVDDE